MEANIICTTVSAEMCAVIYDELNSQNRFRRIINAAIKQLKIKTVTFPH